jgi:hypothetical protein
MLSASFLLLRIRNHLLPLRSLHIEALLIGLFLTNSSWAQNAGQDTILNFPTAIYREYLAGVGGAANLYSGAEYEGVYSFVLGTPFWNSNGFQKGTLCYEGVLYRDVQLAYDLVRNELLTHSLQGQRLRLEKVKLNYFVLTDHTYVHLLPDTTSKNPIPDDIYDVLYNDKIKVYAKRTKVITRGLHAEEKDSFTTRTLYFLFKDNTYYPITREKDLLKIFPDDKRQFKSFWAENRLSFKREPEAFIIQTVSHWSQLKK